MKEPAVADSACLVGLEKIGRLDLLPALFDPVMVTPEVAREFGLSLPWLTLVSPANQASIASLKLLVDDGEAEAIALAQEKQCRVILDDLRARSVATNLGLKIIGIVGILLRAKRSGIIPALKPVLKSLQDSGFYISKSLTEEAIRLAGE